MGPESPRPQMPCAACGFDDVGTDEHNQALSERRAIAVTERLHAALPRADIRAEGRGERQPAVVGKTDAARTVNRRVEITFTGTVSDRPATTITIPTTEAPTARAGEQATITKPGRPQDRYRIALDSVRRHGNLLVGTFTLHASGGLPQSVRNLTGVFGEPRATSRLDLGFGGYGTAMATHQVSLLGRTERVYPLNYLPTSWGWEHRQLLGDQFLNQGPREGRDGIVTVVWPDVGTDTVTVDVPERFRIVDVPVK